MLCHKHKVLLLHANTTSLLGPRLPCCPLLRSPAGSPSDGAVVLSRSQTTLGRRTELRNEKKKPRPALWATAGVVIFPQFNFYAFEWALGNYKKINTRCLLAPRRPYPSLLHGCAAQRRQGKCQKHRDAHPGPRVHRGSFLTRCAWVLTVRGAEEYRCSRCISYVSNMICCWF